MAQPMARAVICPDADPDRVARIAEALGSSFARATALGVPELIHDPAISPADLSEGILRAHLFGAVSVLFAGGVAEIDKTELASRAIELWTQLVWASL